MTIYSHDNSYFV